MTTTRHITYDFKTLTGEAYPIGKLRIQLLTAIAIAPDEIYPTMKVDYTADNTGVGEIDLVVPPTGSGFLYSFRLPDWKTYEAIVSYGDGSDLSLSTLLADSYTPPTGDPTLDTNYLRRDGTNTPMTGELLLSGDPISDTGAATKQYVDANFDLAGSAAAAQAASLPKAATLVTATSGYTTLTADGGKQIMATGAGTITLADGMVDGYQIVINRVVVGAVSIVATTTLNKLTDGTGYETIASAALGTTAVCIHLGSNIWLITGDFS